MRWLPLALLLLAAPAAAQMQPQAQGRTPLDQMLAALKSAPDEAAASALEVRIEHAWVEAGSPAVTLLMARGIREAKAGADQDALEDFNAALDLDPKLAEAWHRKALVRFQMGDVPGAIRDIEHVLQLEPRHFAALKNLSQMAESRKDWKGAYAAWRKVLEIDPKAPGGEQRLQDLKRRAFGEET